MSVAAVAAAAVTAPSADSSDLDAVNAALAATKARPLTQEEKKDAHAYETDDIKEVARLLKLGPGECVRRLVSGGAHSRLLSLSEDASSRVLASRGAHESARRSAAPMPTHTHHTSPAPHPHPSPAPSSPSPAASAAPTTGPEDALKGMDSDGDGRLSQAERH